MDASFVIPCYRSPASLSKLVSDLVEQANGANHNFEIVLVQDSPDSETSSLLDRLEKQFKAVRTVRLSRNFGQQAATVAGIVESRGDIIVTLDDDYQHRPADALEMIRILTGDPAISLVYARPVIPSDSATRVKSGSLFRRVLKVSGLKFADSLSPFRAFRGYLREAFTSTKGPNVSVDIILGWVIDNPHTFETEFNVRTDGKSGYTQKALLKLALSILLTQTVRPLRAGIHLGIFGVAGSLVFGLFILGNYLFGGIAVPGFATTILLILLLGSLQLFILGIIGLYVGEQHKRGMRQPAYFIANPGSSTATGADCKDG